MRPEEIVVARHVTDVNNGNQGATGVVLALPIPQHTSFELAASSAGWSYGPNRQVGILCSLGIGTLDSSVGGAVFFALRVDAGVPAGVGAILLQGSILDDGLNGPAQNPADNVASDSTVTAV